MDVWSQTAERPKYRRDAQFGMIKPFSEHLHLNYAIENAVSEVSHHARLFIGFLLAVYYRGVVSTFLVERTDSLGMIDGARNADQLMLRAR